MEFGGLSLSLKFEFQKTLPSLLTIEGSYVPAAEQRISAVGLTIYMLLVALSYWFMPWPRASLNCANCSEYSEYSEFWCPLGRGRAFIIV